VRAIVAMCLVVQLGCTVVFPVLGGLSASSANRDARARGRPEPASVGNRVVGGVLIGLLVDVLVLSLWASNLEHQPEG